MNRIILTGWATLLLVIGAANSNAAETRTISSAELRDRIRGGWAGQMIGDIQGLPFEFRYKDEPGPLPDFTPNLPICRSDDDTDIEWVHLHLMNRLGTAKAPYPDLARQWVRSMNQKIWVSNKKARELMGQGIIPPWTSHPALNPHARYNLSGQFCAEMYGFVAPGLPREAADIGSHYVRVTIRGEPMQACAYWTSMISMAFFDDNIERLARESLAAVDPESETAEMIRDVLKWYHESPDDWRALREKVQKEYRDRRKWNMNSTISNGAFVLAALLYGKGDFVQTMRLAFAMGYDADCNAATCGAVLGVMLGAKKMAANPGWELPQLYTNDTRDGLPKRQTLDEIVAMTEHVARKVIQDAGGTIEGDGEDATYRIPVQKPALLERLEKLPPADPPPDPEPVLKEIDRWAYNALDSKNTTERTFAAIHLVNWHGKTMRAEERKRFRQALEAARDDEVLGDLATKALEKLGGNEK